jgi:hypothetical protein
MRLDAVVLEICADDGAAASPPPDDPTPPATPTEAAPPTAPPPTAEPEIVCGDLLRGAGAFESGLAEWRRSGNHVATAAAAGSPQGGMALRLGPPDTSAEFGYAAVERSVGATRLLTATLGAWVLREGGAGPALLEVRRPSRGERRPLFQFEDIAVADEWQRIDIDVEPESVERGVVYAGGLVRRGTGAGVWVDGVTLNACWIRSWSALLPAASRP